jgi:hypothetical protein
MDLLPFDMYECNKLVEFIELNTLLNQNREAVVFQRISP